MKSTTFKGVFKSEQQLIDSGWRKDSYGHYRHKNCTPSVNPMMLQLEGRVLEVGKVVDTMYTWTISKEMLLSETEIVEQLIKEYDE